jgi:hypothetical protein
VVSHQTKVQSLVLYMLESTQQMISAEYLRSKYLFCILIITGLRPLVKSEFALPHMRQAQAYETTQCYLRGKDWSPIVSAVLEIDRPLWASCSSN